MTDHASSSIEDLTIRDMFSVSPDRTGVAAGIDAGDFKDIAKQISSLSQPIPWSRVQQEVADFLPGMLDISLLDAWARAWQKSRDVKDDAEKSRNSPESIVLSALAEHSIDSTFQPYLEFFLGPEEIGKITFDVILTTTLQGLVLGLKAGKIVSLQLGRCEWTGAIGVRGITLVDRKLKELDFPGRITLKNPIPLGGEG